jgi:hypothetical protein
MARRFYGGNPGGSLRDLLIASTTAGFGISLGRGVYKKTSKNALLILAAIVFLGGTAYGVWNLTRGHRDRSVFRFIWCGALVAVSVAATYALFTSMSYDAETGVQNINPLVPTLAVQGAVALVAALVGLVQRGKRMRGYAIQRHNEAFLDANGLRDVGGRDQIMIDAAGNELKLDDNTRSDAITFKIEGRRGVRARIELDGEGRMTRYVFP